MTNEYSSKAELIIEVQNIDVRNGDFLKNLIPPEGILKIVDLITQAQIELIENLIQSQPSYIRDSAYSENEFYVVDLDEVLNKKKELQSTLKKEQ